jgi:adenine-specific DNA-methyltransferase
MAKVKESLESLILNTNAKFILISYNNEGYLSETDFFDVMSKYGTIQSFEKEYSVFKGGNIKSNNRSNKVKELLFLLKKK